MKEQITLYPPHGNRRREYGIQYFVNGGAVMRPHTLQTGDVVSGVYLGGNAFQDERNLAGYKMLVSLGFKPQIKDKDAVQVTIA